MRIPALVLIVIMCLSGLTRAQVVINEVGTGTVDYVEYMNLGASAVVVGGYACWFGNEVLNPNAFGYGVPAGASIATNRALLFTDNGGGLPALQAGTAAYALPANTIKWQPGNPGSCSLLDSAGNGLDYFAFGNPNLFKSLFKNGAGVATTWTGDGAPVWGTETGVNSQDTFVRHTRGDTNSANDWSMTTAVNWTPSYLNRFQTFTNADGLPPVVTFSASVTSGVSPLTVRFTNTSTGDCQLGTLSWDFDATTNPGLNTSALYNDAFTFVNPPATPGGTVVNYDVILSIMDSCGGMVQSAITTIAVTEPFTAVAQTYPYLEDFEGAIDPNTGTSMSSTTGWEVVRSNANAQVQTVDPRTLGVGPTYSDAIRALPTTVVMDSIANGLTTTQEIVLHLDAETMFLLNGGAGFRVVLWAQHFGESASANDLICFQDGQTLGDAVDSQGNILVGTPGHGGYQEYLLADLITAIGPAFTWTRLEYNFDAAFFTNNGLAVPTGLGLANDCRIVIRHESSGSLGNAQALLVDRVQILDQSVSSAGSPGIPGLAVMDISHAANVNDHFVGYPGDEAGPHFSTLPGQGTMDLDITGEVNQPIILLSGPLNLVAASYPFDPNLGQFDIGGAPDMTGIPTLLVVLADGTATYLPPTLFNLIWNTGADGVFSLSVALPPGIPSGTMIPMQSVVLRSFGSGASISNAVVLTIQ